MKRSILIILTSCMLISLTGCSEETVNINVENSTELYNTMFGKNTLIEIGDGLWYDSTTRIVYWWNSRYYGNNATTPTAYYAPNGKPYKYNPETNTFEQIND